MRSTARFRLTTIAFVALALAGSSVAYGADQLPQAAGATVTAVAQTSLAPLTAASLTSALMAADSTFRADEQPALNFSAARLERTVKSTRALRIGMYASFAALQALDAHSTVRALRAGGREANPFMSAVASRPLGLVAVKAGTAAATIVLVEKLSKRNPIASVLVMTALNSAYATIVAHNYNVAARR